MNHFLHVLYISDSQYKFCAKENQALRVIHSGLNKSPNHNSRHLHLCLLRTTNL